MSSIALWLVAAGAALAAGAFGALAYVLRRAPAAAPGPPRSLERETQQLRDAAWFAATLELDALALRIVEAGLAACEADGAAVALSPSADGDGAFEVLHLAPAEVDWISGGLQGDSDGTAIMRYPDVESPPGDERIKTAVFVPIPGLQGETFGTLAAGWRRDLGDETDERLGILEGVADSAWPAVDNARKYKAARAPGNSRKAPPQDTSEPA